MAELETLRGLSPGGRLILASRSVRLLGFGALPVVMASHLTSFGLSEAAVGQLFAITLAGDIAVTLWATLHADSFGRRRTLMLSAWLMMLAGLALPFSTNYAVAAVVMFVGAISLNGGETGPFMAIEQAALTETVAPERRTTAIAWYTLAGSMAAALGALLAGAMEGPVPVLILYAACGAVLFALALRLPSNIEAVGNSPAGSRFGLGPSRGIVFRLAGLFMVDTLGSGLVLQSFLAYWIERRFGASPGMVGAIFFGMNLLAAVSAMVAGRLAGRIGLINTMVWTHIPANVLLILLPWAPNLTVAAVILLLRGCLSQMDVPARQSYLMAVVEPGERSAAGGVTGLAKSIANAAAPGITGVLFAAGWMAAPFVAGGLLKIAYDLALWRSFRAIKPPEER